LNTATDNVFPTLDEHRSHTWMNLLEGNVTSKIQLDNVWGSGSHDTMFRNYARGTDPNKGNYRTAIDLDAFHRYNNAMANVLGDPTLAIHYTCDAVVTNVDRTIFDLGGYNGCGTTPYDSVVESTLVRWGNWDAVTYNASGSSHHGTQWCTGSGAGLAGTDAYNIVCAAAETASSDPSFPGLASPSTTLPASFYLAATPSWWGTVAWPPIGPDVTGGNLTNTGGHANQIPAQVCYNNTAKDGTGFLTAYDANSCYSTIAPAPPTGLTVVVQ